MGKLLTPRFAPTALSSEGNDNFVTNRQTDRYYGDNVPQVMMMMMTMMMMMMMMILMMAM